MDGPTPFEKEVLKYIAGIPSEVKQWGAAVGASLGFLKKLGLVTYEGKLTEAGKDYVAKELK